MTNDDDPERDPAEPPPETGPDAGWDAPPPEASAPPPAEASPDAGWAPPPAEASVPPPAGWEAPPAEASVPPPAGWEPPPPEPVVAPGTGPVTGASPADSLADRPEEPLLPLSADEDALRSAAGVRPRRRPGTEAGDDDDDDERPRSRKLVMVAALSGVLGLVIAAFVVFGTINKQRYVIACEPDHAIAEQGRGFPPWGTSALEDEAMWKPIAIPPEAECRERETDDEDELSAWYLEMLEARADTLLRDRDVTKADEAAALLEQALLHARAPERRDQRTEIERLLGDVQYWRASAKLRDAAAALVDAAKQFDAAAAQRPRHVSDATAWALHARRLADELRGGPAGAKATPFAPPPSSNPDPAPERPPAPPGVALPVEPEPDAGAPDEPAPPPDAGIPTGGVLL